MIKKAIHFIKYNNAFTIGMMIFLFGFGVTFAAGPAVVGAVYSSSESVTSIDNHALLAADLDTFDPYLKINAATEDTQNYYVTYSYTTLAIQDGVWQPVPMSKVLTVSKEIIADQDLGLYVAKQLSDNMKAEVSYLKRVQVLAKANGESSKVVTTEYSGLVGKLLDPKSEVIAGYTPVIPAPVAAPVAAASVAVDPDPSLFVENIPGYVKPAPVQSSAASPALSEADIKRLVDQYLASGSGSTTSASSTSDTTPVVVPSDPGSTPPPADVPPPPPVDTTPADTATTTPSTTTSTTTPPSTPSQNTGTASTTPPAASPPTDTGTTTATSSTTQG